MRFVWPEPYSDSMDEIWDIGNCPVWEDAQRQILEKIWYDVMRDEGWSKLFVQSTSNNCKEDEGRKEMEQCRQPMAKVMAQFKKSSSLLFEMDGDSVDETMTASSTKRSRESLEGRSLAGRLQRLPTVLELGDVSFGEY